MKDESQTQNEQTEINEEVKNQSDANAENTESVTEEAPAEKDEKSALETRVSELEKQNAELKDQYLRKVADFDNYRKRMMREKQDAFDYANTAILTDLVSFLDDFDRALASSEDATDIKAITEGIKMMNKQLYGLLNSKYNLSCYGTKGDAFDPNIHEAIASTPSDVKEPTCAEVYLKGYMLKERVIRPAKVMVHMPGGDSSKETSEEQK